MLAPRSFVDDRAPLALLIGGVAVAGVVLCARTRYLRAGATDDEVALRLPGDQLVPRPDVTATRAVTVRASADEVWPWIAQIGQGRGGFYSYDWLENLIGCAIRSADEIVPAWQSPAVGDAVHLHPEVSLRIAELEPGQALVLRGGIPMGTVAPPYDCTWAFVVREHADGTTRVLSRERYAYTRWWAPLLVEPVQLISFVMSRRMLAGIRARAEQRSVRLRA